MNPVDRVLTLGEVLVTMNEYDIQRCRKIAERYCRRAGAMHLVDDAHQEAMLAFWRCSERVDESKGVAWQLGSSRVPGAVMDYLRTMHYRVGFDPLPADFIPIDQAALPPCTEKIEISTDAQMLMEPIRPRLREVLLRTYWLEQPAPEVGERMQLSQTRVLQLKDDALQSIREHIARA